MARSVSLTLPGASLYYKVRGNGPILLVLQGGSGNADTSDGLASFLDHEFTFVSYDRRGLLRSPVADPRKPLTIEQHAEDVRTLVDHISSGPVFMFGTSVGAMIGLEFTRNRIPLAARASKLRRVARGSPRYCVARGLAFSTAPPTARYGSRSK